jgi:ADP-ribosyl-[dinitrogen reductase] hydrolase
LTKDSAMVTAAEGTLQLCQAHPRGSEVTAALEKALSLADRSPQATPEQIEILGAGWVAEEALAISVYCAATAADFRSGVLSAVNHSGDSDSTGAITGNLLGTHLGLSAIGSDLLDPLEGRDTIQQIAADLHAFIVEGNEPDWERYPPW